MQHQLASQGKMSDANLHKGSKSSNKPMLSNHSPIHHILQLHKMVGNRAVRQMIQAKLKIGQPGDVYEQEANRVADAVMQGQGGNIQIQRKCTDCAQKEEETALRAKEEAGQTPGIRSNLEGDLQAMRGGGQPLPASVRDFFEPRFGQDFSRVRIHTDSRATRSAKAIHARAFTMGQDIAFGEGEYSPGTAEGQRLLAHELVHTVQQSSQAAPAVVMRNVRPRTPSRPAQPTQPACSSMKKVTVDIVSLAGSTRSPFNDLNFANSVFSRCCVNFEIGQPLNVPPGLASQWLGANFVMDRPEVNALVSRATTRFGLSSRIKIFYAVSNTLGSSHRRGFSRPSEGTTFIFDAAADRTLAHELGHHLLNSGDHPDPPNLMAPTEREPIRTDLLQEQCTRMQRFH